MFGRIVLLGGLGLAVLAAPSQAASIADEKRFEAVRPVEPQTVAPPPAPVKPDRPGAAPQALTTPPRPSALPQSPDPRPSPSKRAGPGRSIILLMFGLLALVAIVRWLARRRLSGFKRV